MTKKLTEREKRTISERAAAKGCQIEFRKGKIIFSSPNHPETREYSESEVAKLFDL